MDILYIYKHNGNDEEIKYSLRSVDKFCKYVSNVYIVGDFPSFIKKDSVGYIEASDDYCANLNHFFKVLTAIQMSDISKSFMLMYDDIFFCERCDIRKYHWYNIGQLPTNPKNAYEIGLVNARIFLNKNKTITANFETHTPCIYNSDNFMSLAEAFYLLRDNPAGMSVRSVYANLFVSDFKTLEKDVKIRDDRFDLCGPVLETKCFSTGDNTYNVAKQWLHETFKEKSRWEK